MASLHTTRATIWSTIDVGIRQAMQFVVGIALARLLDPSAFGALAMMTAVTSMAGLLVDGGFSAALIQRSSLSRIDESTVFWCSIALSSMLAATLALGSTWIEAAFSLPGLGAPLAALSSVLVISAIGTVPITLMTKRLDFRSHALVGAITLIASAPVAIYLAIRGYGVWALVWQSIVSNATSTVTAWVITGWRPQFVFSLVSLGSLFRFGGFMLATIAAETASARVPTLILGVVGGPRDVGLFSRAEATAALPTSVIQRIAGRVAFSAYSKIANDRHAICRNALKALQSVSLVAMPASFGLSAVAESLVLTLLGQKWADSVPLLSIMAIAGVGLAFHVVNLSALMAIGQSKRFFALHLCKSAVLLGAVGGAAPFGLLPMAVAFTLATVVGASLNLAVAGRWIGLCSREQLAAVFPALFASTMMWAVLTVFRGIFDLAQPGMLAAGVTLGALVYLLLLLLLREPVAISVVQHFLRARRRH